MIQENQVASIEYELKDPTNGKILDSNKGSSPLEFIFGAGTVINGLKEGLKSYNEGQEGTIKVDAKDAYGEYDPAREEKLSIDNFEGIKLEKDLTLYGQTEDGQTIPAKVKDFDDKEVTLDYNHPLAGKNLEFDVKLLALRDASPEEQASGQVAKDAASGCCGSGGGCCD
ncbi:MAG: FKBP-type peptidyl-prolyl cis-trans isomerase SlyD (EC [uncultured Campylobacterales bacterium]|uniref:Peptidyl-prolyl cis-trans isomerase n=1 Tax=uncultured Campylobacterales bacterium TaxID=352960 RepID=A0A6S6S9C4_9BACT|nr:MAG: FKBP-type peptidyl-prolyl cis-trans isomerase SlyD (EC [uncultured Campylobacterales bacterium]